MKNKLTDLNDILFVQLERLTGERMSADAIAKEIKRSEAVVQVADRVVDNARLQLAACKLVAENGTLLKGRIPAALMLPAGTPGA